MKRYCRYAMLSEVQREQIAVQFSAGGDPTLWLYEMTADEDRVLCRFDPAQRIRQLEAENAQLWDKIRVLQGRVDGARFACEAIENLGAEHPTENHTDAMFYLAHNWLKQDDEVAP